VRRTIVQQAARPSTMPVVDGSMTVGRPAAHHRAEARAPPKVFVGRRRQPPRLGASNTRASRRASVHDASRRRKHDHRTARRAPPRRSARATQNLRRKTTTTPLTRATTTKTYDDARLPRLLRQSATQLDRPAPRRNSLDTLPQPAKNGPPVAKNLSNSKYHTDKTPRLLIKLHST
jgi:predicted acyl esterase